MRDFKKYDIWQLSHSLTLAIYKLTSNFPKEFNYFLSIALGSANETEYLLILSKDLQYIDNENAELFLEKINIIKSKIYSLKQILMQNGKA